MALSAHGITALIGGPNDNANVGAAWVFTHSGTTWTQQGYKADGQQAEVGEGLFGYSVALSSEGNTGLIGGFGDNNERGRGVGVREHRPHGRNRSRRPASRRRRRR